MNNNYKETTPEVIKRLRIESRMTQKELADKLGIGRTTIVGYEKGSIKPSVKILVKMCDVFNIPIETFLKEKNYTLKNEMIDIEYHLNQTILDVRSNKFSFKENSLSMSDRIILINTFQNLIKILNDLHNFY